MKANEIVSVLNNFKDSSYQRVFIDGTWGIGKTKYVLDFKDAHSDACYVSLFGKKDIESIIQEIYFQIIDSVPNGKFKKYYRKVREKFNNVDIAFHGLTISVPLIEKLHSTLYKELDKKGTYVIIFDDLERKHHDLDIKEILGLIDSLAKIENIKTVLIAATDQLEEDEETFNNYKEKAIDRTYTIEEYADEAPINILGEEVWKVIGKLAENFDFSNLRTFEKTNLFLKEVIGVIGEDDFTDKFTKDDVYRMCFATVFFKIEQKGEMKLLNSNNDNSKIMNAYYTEDKSGVVEYLDNYILRNSLDNVRSKNVLHLIKDWYDSGTFSKENIIRLINLINSYEEKPKNFYSSEEEIVEVINHSREYIKNLDETQSIDDIVSNLQTAFPWCEILSIKFGISNEEIVNRVKTNITNHINIEKTIYENEIDLWQFHVESEEAKTVFKLINEAIKAEYYDQLLNQIKDSFDQKSYQNYSYLRKLADSISSTKVSSIQNNVLKSLDDNDFFFPVPSGKITDEQWQWCHLIVSLIATIQQNWGQAGYFGVFSAYISSLEITQKDKMLQHRLKQLFGKDIELG
ncbi:P-loop NTPase fold protein [Halobacillus sp. Marseille-Q1614]|uniref:P-loop NTPase fold protein n=1 Tax=Halobacillus sp. Marseille-Q1614 TaxID=2709134 RepID=UPI0015708308|nr:P-loop NTPase fold protein [Halobacillus sp. Marseille-Q1614]